MLTRCCGRRSTLFTFLGRTQELLVRPVRTVSGFDKVMWFGDLPDHEAERKFVTELDTSKEVAVYAKLPRGFFIPTPVGDYNPDWAVAFTEGAVNHIYFIAETKGSLSSLQLKGAEEAKIECAKKFFAALNNRHGGDIRYGVVSDYTTLMQLVTV